MEMYIALIALASLMLAVFSGNNNGSGGSHAISRI